MVARSHVANVPELSSCSGTRRRRPGSQANLQSACWPAGQIDPRLWGADEFKAHADLCIHCKLCRTECPSAVDVSSLMLEAKAAHVDKHGLGTSDWILSRGSSLGRGWGAGFPIVTNFLLGATIHALLARSGCWAISASPALAPRARERRIPGGPSRLGLNKPRPQLPGPRVVYFVDVFANYYDQELAEAVVAVLQQAGVNVYVPHRRAAAREWSPLLIVGDIDHACDQAQANLRVLANAECDGYTVVCSEPTAALMLREEYVKLTEDLDAELVAANTMDVGQYLLGLEVRGQLPRPREPLHARVGYHQPCHLRALDVGNPPGAAAQRPGARRRSSSTEVVRAWAVPTGWLATASLPHCGPAVVSSGGYGTETSISAPPNAGRAGSRWEQGVTMRTLPSHQTARHGLRAQPHPEATLQRPQAAPRHVVRDRGEGGRVAFG